MCEPDSKLLIAIPTFETITTECIEALYNADKPDNIEITFKSVKGYDCARARNEIVKYALSHKFDYILMIDSDVIIPKDGIITLFNQMDIGKMITGYYPQKGDPDRTEIFRFNRQRSSSFLAVDRWNTKELEDSAKFGYLIPIHGCGFGCVLLATADLRKMQYPYFKYVIYDNETFLSEDLYFCTKFPGRIFVHTKVRCKHVGKKIV